MAQEYNEALEGYHLTSKERDYHSLEIHFGDKLSKDQIKKIVDEGQTEQLIKQSISDDLNDTINTIQSRHQSILQLEREIREVQQLFIDLSVLVNISGEHLDHIETSIRNAKDSVEKGADNLVIGQKEQSKARNRMCCIIIIVLVVLIVILAPVLVNTMAKT